MVSFSVCFSVLSACRLIPKNNEFMHGLADGSTSAQKAIDDFKRRADESRRARKAADQNALDGWDTMSRGSDCLAHG
jgi:hypothetical protein